MNPGSSIAMVLAIAPAAAAATAALAAEAHLAIAATDASLQWAPCPPVFAAGCQVAVLHGDPARPNADIFLRAPGGSVLPPHSHTSAERMILVTGRLEVKYAGAPAVTLTPGMYAYGPAGLPHRAACAAGQPCTLFIAFEGPVDALPFAGSVD